MLWDLIYNVDTFRISNVSVGLEVSHHTLSKFKYAFSTVPTVKLEN